APKAMTATHDVGNIIDGLKNMSPERKNKIKNTIIEHAGKAIGSQMTSLEDVSSWAKDFAIAGLELIPGGGLFISPLVDLIWGVFATPTNQMEQLLEQIDAMMNEKINTNNVTLLKSDFEALSTQLHSLEDLLNNSILIDGKPVNSGISMYNDAGTATQRAEAVENAFDKLLNNCRSVSQEATLPLYTAVSIAHQQFLNFMKTNWNDTSKFDLSKAAYDSKYGASLNRALNAEYKVEMNSMSYTSTGGDKGYINIRGQMASMTQHAKLKEIFEKAKSERVLSNKASYSNPEQALNEMEDSLRGYTEQNNAAAVNILDKACKEFKTVQREINEYADVTVNLAANSLS
ncbi:hypothetical protein COC69_12690, partial [Bacillus cereus]